MQCKMYRVNHRKIPYVKPKHTPPNKQKRAELIAELQKFLPLSHEEILGIALFKYYKHKMLEQERNPSFMRNLILQTQKQVCYYCRTPILKKSDCTLDHKIPVSRGGSLAPENICVACNKCNNEKDILTDKEYMRRIWYIKIKRWFQMIKSLPT